MPIFEYNCLKCHDSFEIMHISSNHKKAVCPKCGSNDIKKLLSSFATHSSSFKNVNSCDPSSCGLPAESGGMPPCGAGGCGMM